MLDEMALGGPEGHTLYTTVVTALVHAGHAASLFRSMLAEAAPPNEVTLADVFTALARQDGAWGCCAAGHGCVRYCDH
jgi:hypothetical protein